VPGLRGAGDAVESGSSSVAGRRLMTLPAPAGPARLIKPGSIEIVFAGDADGGEEGAAAGIGHRRPIPWGLEVSATGGPATRRRLRLIAVRLASRRHPGA
jgi:hypothetical protein